MRAIFTVTGHLNMSETKYSRNWVMYRNDWTVFRRIGFYLTGLTGVFHSSSLADVYIYKEWGRHRLTTDSKVFRMMNVCDSGNRGVINLVINPKKAFYGGV